VHRCISLSKMVLAIIHAFRVQPPKRRDVLAPR